jgi:hypothetical protein
MLIVSRTGDRRSKDSGGVNHHYKTCKEIMSKQTSKQIFLYSISKWWLKENGITTGLPPGKSFTFIVREQDYLHTFEDWFVGATGDLVATRVAFLMRRENFIEKFSTALGFLSGVIAFLTGLIVTMTWLHFLVPLSLNVDVSSSLPMLSFMIRATTTIIASVVLKNGLPRMSSIWQQTFILSTTKSTSTKEFLILTGISSVIPTGCRVH